MVSGIVLYLLLGDLQSFYSSCMLHVVGQFCDGYLVGSNVGVSGPVGYLGGIRGVVGLLAKVG